MSTEETHPTDSERKMVNNLSKEFLAETKLDEAVYELFKLGWDESQVYDKVENLWVLYQDEQEEEE